MEEEIDALWEEVKKKRFTVFESIMSAIYGVGPLPVGLDKERFRIKNLIKKSLNEKGEIKL